MAAPPPSDPKNEQPPPGDAPDTLNSAADILKYNLAKQQEHEKPVIPEEKKSRKLRDYLICMVVVNALLILPNLFPGTNVVTLIFSFSGIVIFSSGFSWIMWTVIGDY